MLPDAFGACHGERSSAAVAQGGRHVVHRVAQEEESRLRLSPMTAKPRSAHVRVIEFGRLSLSPTQVIIPTCVLSVHSVPCRTQSKRRRLAKSSRNSSRSVGAKFSPAASESFTSSRRKHQTQCIPSTLNAARQSLKFAANCVQSSVRSACAYARGCHSRRYELTTDARRSSCTRQQCSARCKSWASTAICRRTRDGHTSNVSRCPSSGRRLGARRTQTKQHEYTPITLYNTPWSAISSAGRCPTRP